MFSGAIAQWRSCPLSFSTYTAGEPRTHEVLRAIAVKRNRVRPYGANGWKRGTGGTRLARMNGALFVLRKRKDRSSKLYNLRGPAKTARYWLVDVFARVSIPHGPAIPLLLLCALLLSRLTRSRGKSPPFQRPFRLCQVSTNMLPHSNSSKRDALRVYTRLSRGTRSCRLSTHT